MYCFFTISKEVRDRRKKFFHHVKQTESINHAERESVERRSTFAIWIKIEHFAEPYCMCAI